MSAPALDRFLEEADRAERVGDFVGAAIALRNHLERSPEDRPTRLRFARLLMVSGERAAARQVLLPFEVLEPEDPIAREATRRLAELDEAEGAVLSAIERWERILADDIDDAQARAHLALLRPAASRGAADPSQTLVSPEGVEVARFRLLREIGRGATATVYLARDSALAIDLALKILHPQLAGSGGSDACRRFFAEARVAAGIRHPGVVAIYDVDEASRSLAMEWVPGGTLRERLRAHGGPLPLDEIGGLARTLLGTLAYVHSRGVAHGDLKPSNLLLRRPGEIVLADFGAAELTGAWTQLGAAERSPSRGGPGTLPGARLARSGRSLAAPGGTPLYLAPEQFGGAPTSPAADVFAAGAILWEALAGRPLRSQADLLAGQDPDPRLPDEVTRRLGPSAARWSSLLEGLLAPDPGRRASP